jgi:hypothetical protein
MAVLVTTEITIGPTAAAPGSVAVMTVVITASHAPTPQPAATAATAHGRWRAHRPLNSPTPQPRCSILRCFPSGLHSASASASTAAAVPTAAAAAATADADAAARTPAATTVEITTVFAIARTFAALILIIVMNVWRPVIGFLPHLLLNCFFPLHRDTNLLAGLNAPRPLGIIIIGVFQIVFKSAAPGFQKSELLQNNALR